MLPNYINYDYNNVMKNKYQLRRIMMDNKILKALKFASKKHENCFRKDGKTPYITHLIEVMNILISEGYDHEVVVAGLLHDVIEDTYTTTKEIKRKFGDEILLLVMYNSENKSLSWKERKEITIEKLKNEWDEKASAVCFADKLSNLRSIFRDIEYSGHSIWKRFKADRDAVLKYYEDIFNQSFHLNGKAFYYEYYKLLELIKYEVTNHLSEVDEIIRMRHWENTAQYLLDDNNLNYPDAMPDLLRLAERFEDHEAECILGNCYLRGNGVECDPEKAILYFQLSTQHGNMDAPAYLGHIYVNGIYVDKDLEVAYDYFKLAVERGCDFAKDALDKLILSKDFKLYRFVCGTEEDILDVIKKDKESNSGGQ